MPKGLFIINREEEGIRLDTFLAKAIDSLSRSKIKKLIEEGRILVGGVKKKGSYHLKFKDIVTVDYVNEEKSSLLPYPCSVRVIYEDKDIIVVDKPENLVVHPPNIHYQKTLVNALLYMGKELSSIGPLRRGIVHRLDKETSGVMVLAKTNQSHLNLREQFRERKVIKEYRAIVWGLVKKEVWKIELPIRRDSYNRLKMKVGFISSRYASTEMKVLKRFEDATYLSIKPITGRTHQIRVHLKFLGYPIVGDKKYGIKDGYKDLFLHAYRLGFYHPRETRWVEFTSPIPARFREFIRERENV